MMNQKPFRGIQINKTHPLAKGLVLATIFNEKTGSKVFDLSGNGNNGTITGADWVADGLDFGIISDNSKYISVTSQSIIDLPASGIFSVVVSNTPNYSGVSAKAVLAWGGTDDLLLYPNDNLGGAGGMRVFWRDAGGNAINYSGADLYDTKVQSIFTSKIGEQKAYQDEVLIGSNTLGLSGVGPFNSFRIGNWVDSVQPFGGTVHYVYIYNRALSASEVAWLNREPYVFFERPVNPAIMYYESVGGVTIPVFAHYYNQMRS